jgi:hypothetical protein
LGAIGAALRAWGGMAELETVAEYVEILTLTVGELASELGISVPKGMPQSLRVRIFGGGPLVFDEYGQVKYQIRTTLEETDRQTKRLKYLWETAGQRIQRRILRRCISPRDGSGGCRCPPTLRAPRA